MAAADVELRSTDLSGLDAGKGRKNSFAARATRRASVAFGGGGSNGGGGGDATNQPSAAATFPFPREQLKHHFVVIVLFVLGSMMGNDSYYDNLGNKNYL